MLHVNCNDVIHQGAELRDTLREADVPVIHQVRGAFEDLIRGAARGRYFRQKSKKTRNGIVPDLRWRDEDGEFVLGDVKTIGFGKTRYWGRRPASTRAVDARAASVHTDMRSKLRSIDREILGRSPNGPLELRLSAVGPIQGLVFGAFGEISEEARTLLCYAADATAARTWVADGATSEEHAAALLKNRLYRRWGIKTAREYARIKIDGLRLVGGNPDFTNAPGHGDDDARFYDRQQAYVHARGYTVLAACKTLASICPRP